jgi:hypothetical protein
MVNIAAVKNAPQVYPTTFGRNGAGGIPLPGAAVGDTVSDVRNITSPLSSIASSFETSISKAGQIQQTSSSNLSAEEFWFILVHQM